MNPASKRSVLLLVTLAMLAGALAFIAPVSGQDDEQAAPFFVTTIPSGYRDWTFISVAHEEGNLNSFSAILGNDVAIKAYREGKLPFPDGTIIAALHYQFVPSEENNKVFGRPQSFVAGPPTNVQFMVKDSKKYASTGGWGVRSFPKRQAWRRGVHETLFPVPRARLSGLRFHSVRTLKRFSPARPSSKFWLTGLPEVCPVSRPSGICWGKMPCATEENPLATRSALKAVGL